jgi:hypothetical protein
VDGQPGLVSGSAGFDQAMARYGGLGVVRVYSSGAIGTVAGNQLLNHIVTTAPTGTMIVYSWKTWDSTAVGQFIVSAGTTYRGYQWRLAYHHEPENDGFGDSDKAAWRDNHTAMVSMAASYPNVQVWPILMRYTLNPASGRNPADWYVPAVAGYGWDGYDTGYPQGKYSDVAGQIDPIIAQCATWGKPWGIGEFSSAFGPKRITDYPTRRAWIQAYADYCVAHAGTGSGQCSWVSLWSRPSTAKWPSTDPNYTTYGPISKIDYRVDTDPPLVKLSPAAGAGSPAYGEVADPAGAAMWASYCSAGRRAHGIADPS